MYELCLCLFVSVWSFFVLCFVVLWLYFFFFFSSRRRHTRWTGDWSSDVCSSDLTREALGIAEYAGPRGQILRVCANPSMLKDGSSFGAHAGVCAAELAQTGFTEIGRASCRERV